MASRYPQVLDVRPAGPGDVGECCICAENLTDIPGNFAVCRECNAAFHETCLNPWIRIQETGGALVTCPICRREYGKPAGEEPSSSQLASQIAAQELEEANAAAARIARLEEQVQDLQGWIVSIIRAGGRLFVPDFPPRTPPPPTGRLSRLEEDVQGLRVRVANLHYFPIDIPQPRTPPTAPSAHLTRLEEDTSELYRRIEGLRNIRGPPPRPQPPPPTTGFSTVSTGVSYTTRPLAEQGSDSWSQPSRPGSRASSLSFDESRPTSPHGLIDSASRPRRTSYLRRRPSGSDAHEPDSSDDGSDDECNHLRLQVHSRQGPREGPSRRSRRTERRESGRSNGGSDFLRLFLALAAGRPFSTRQVRIRRDTDHGGHFERLPRR